RPPEVGLNWVVLHRELLGSGFREPFLSRIAGLKWSELATVPFEAEPGERRHVGLQHRVTRIYRSQGFPLLGVSLLKGIAATRTVAAMLLGFLTGNVGLELRSQFRNGRCRALKRAARCWRKPEPDRGSLRSIRLSREPHVRNVTPTCW